RRRSREIHAEWKLRYHGIRTGPEGELRAVRAMRRAGLMEMFVSVGCLGGLIATLAVLDERVRQQVVAFSTNPNSNAVMFGGSRLRGFVMMLFYIARDQSQQHALLMMFAL